MEDVDALILPLRRLMERDLVTTRAECMVAEVARTMVSRNVGCALVLDTDGHLLGIFTERDLLTRVVGAGRDPATTRLGEVMTREVATLEADMSVETAADLLGNNGFRHVPITTEGRLTGVVSMRDLLRVRLRQVQASLDREVRSLQELRSLLTQGEEERISSLLAVNERLQELALTDELTGLHNYRYFIQRLHEEVARSKRVKTPLSLLFVDIDHFKRVNDTYGHPAGDRVLTRIATLLRHAVDGQSIVIRLRRSDVVARYGGEEFAVLLMDTRAEGGAVVAERVRSAIARDAVQLGDGTEIRVTVSVGLAELPKHASDCDELMCVADAALYGAKAAGRDRVVVATSRSKLP